MKSTNNCHQVQLNKPKFMAFPVLKQIYKNSYITLNQSNSNAVSQQSLHLNFITPYVHVDEK